MTASGTSELRPSYRAHSWVDKYGIVWTWDLNYGKWRGRGRGTDAEFVATENQLNDYSLFGGRGPFLKLAG